MRNALKFMIIGSVAGLALAGPAFAQSFNPADGTGNTLPFAYAPVAGTHESRDFRLAARQAYAEAPSTFTLRETGNGSPGYERLLQTFGTR